MNLSSAVTGSLLAQRTVRFDKQVVLAIVIFMAGWASSTGAYSVGWLRYRSDALTQVQKAVAPEVKSAPTSALVAEAKALRSSNEVASELGCVEPVKLDAKK